MKLIRFRGGYTDLSAAALTAYNDGLQSIFGLTAVGAPVRRTFGTDGLIAMAAYQQAVIGLLAKGGQVRIQAWLESSVDWEALKQFTRSTFGLINPTEIEDIEQ